MSDQTVVTMPAQARPSSNGHAPKASPPVPAAPPRAPRRRPIVAVGVLAVLALGAFGVWRAFFAGSGLPTGIVAVSGRIEGDDAAVAAKTSGRIREITVREGDRVGAGQLIAPLDAHQLRPP